MRTILSLAFAMLLLVSQPAKAASILYFTDASVGTDRMAQALASPAITGQHTVTTAASLADFATQLGTGNYQLGIFFQQSSAGASYDAAFAALATHIANGGLAIAADWFQDAANSAAFDVTFPAGSDNQLQFTITDPELLVGMSNPVVLTNPGWGIFSYDLATVLGTSGADFPVGGSAIIFGNDRRTIFNGFLGDTFAEGDQGVQLYINQINAVFGATTTPIPEPASIALWGLLGLGAAGYYRRRQQRQAA